MADEGRKGKGDEPRPLSSAPTRNLPLQRPSLLTPPPSTPPSTKEGQRSLSGAKTMQNVKLPRSVSVSDVPMPSSSSSLAEARVRAVLEELAKPGPSSLSYVETTNPGAAVEDFAVAPSASVALPASVEVTAPDPFRVELKVSSHQLGSELDRRLILLREPDSLRAASYRVLRHRLAEQGDPRVIAVSSARAIEGKTTCAANLALALGECGRARVLLVEANLRSPSLAALFGFRPPVCFAEQLDQHRERPEEPWSVVEVAPPGLHIAAVQPGTTRPLIDGLAFSIAIDMLRRTGYDYIVVDTPPVLGCADVNLVADFVDGVVLTTWARRSVTRDLQRAVEQLSPARLLGVTLLDA